MAENWNYLNKNACYYWLQSPLKILIYGFREGSIPPWIREVTPLEKKEDGAVRNPFDIDCYDY